MVQSRKRLPFLRLIALAGAFWAYTGAAAKAEGSGADAILQPQALGQRGVYALRSIDPNLTGSGVKFAVICRSITYADDEPQNDYRPNSQHNCFKDKQFGFYDLGEPAAGISAHSTAICSVLVGEDKNGFNPELGGFHYQGTAPSAKADVYEFWHFLVNNVFPGLPPDADIVSASIGDQFEHWWTRGIESLAEQHGLIVVAGIGNGLNAHDSPLYPAAGANAIGVGVVDSVNTETLATNLGRFALAYPEHSSFGPTADGRCKPDIVAPGNCLAADAGEPNRYEPTGNWSSFSTPIAAGTVGLLVQEAKEDEKLSGAVSPDGGNCVIKAVLMNSATKLPYWHKGRLEKDDDHYAPLDYIQGAGMLNAVEAYRQLRAGQSKPGNVAVTGWDNNALDKGKTVEKVYKVSIPNPAEKYIAATVTWHRHYDSFYPFEAALERDANLRLEVWAVDPNNPSQGHLLDYSDSPVDNVEHVYCRADANYSHYEIVVLNSDTDDPNRAGGSQRYGLAWNVGDGPDGNSFFWYDLTADGIVDELDLAALLNNWIASVRTPASYLLGDIDSNGVVDADDLKVMLEHVNLEADWRTK